MSDPLKIPTDADIELKVDEAKDERRKELEDIREVLKTASGRRWYYRIIEHCRPFTESYVVSMPDVTANNEGRRMVGNWIWAELLDADPDRWFQMLREKRSAVIVKQIAQENKES
jgi:hypothetical protein